ncbi:MAG: helix-turn-helix transcriptional regulator [Thiotrichaceae bacterium]|nr:helix-turn-helix transcriptional regulator [Thiotrichaceae bacterium]PCI12738.1 MAG: hypothetical protein COB71_08155 [Thiotrichales bacterium]
MSGTDPLSQFINNISPQCEVFAQIKLRAPWGIEESQQNCCSFSYLRIGHCVLEVPGQDPLSLQSGQLLLLPYGSPYRLMSEADVNCIQASKLFGGKSREMLELMVVGGKGADYQLMCGNFIFSPLQHWGYDALIGGLPEVIVLDAPPGSRLGRLLLWIYQENCDGKVGHQLAVQRLLELLLLELLRDLDKSKLNLGWLMALGDRNLAPIILAIQQNFSKDWTVEELANLGTLSRSPFSSKFKKITGSSPLNFLRQWRCFVAAQMLVIGNEPVQQIALKCGFQSSDVFIRNFRQFHQITPKQYRIMFQFQTVERSR